MLLCQLTLREGKELALTMGEVMKNVNKRGKRRKRESALQGRMRGGCVRKEERGVYSKTPISRNGKPSSDAPQTKHPIRSIVRDIPQLNGMCANEGTLCGQHN